MNKGALIVVAIVAVAGVAYFLVPSTPPPPPPAQPQPQPRPTPGPKEVDLERQPQVQTQPQPPPKQQPQPKPELEPPPDLDPKNDPLVGLDLEEPTSAELTELKVPEGMTGVVVKKVDPASPAAEAKLEKGDVIVRALRDKITNERSLRALVGDRDQTVLTVYRNGYPFEVVLHKPFHADP